MQEKEELFAFIERAERNVLEGKELERAELIRLLAIDPDS